MALKTSADWRVEIDELSDTNQALIDIAEKEERELRAEEKDLFESNMKKLETAQASLKDAEQFEAHKREIAAMRVAAQTVPNSPVNPIGPRGAADRLNIQHRLGPLRAFKGESAARDAYDSGMWLRGMIARNNRRVDEEAESQIAKRGWTISNVATEGVPTGGGYLVPTPLSNAIIDVRALAGVSRQLCRVVPMTAETQTIAKKTSGTTVYYPGENGTITASDQAWAQVNLTAKKRAILSKVSQELRDDAVIAIIDDLASQMGTDFAVQEDKELIDGDGTSNYGGVSGILATLGSAGIATAATGHDTWGEQDMADFTATMAILPDKYWQYPLAWLCSSGFYFGAMLRVQAAAGGNTISSLEQGANGRPMFLGYPVYFTNHLDTSTTAASTCALFGAFSQAVVIGDRMGISIAQSEHLGFAEDVLAIRATTRYDINCHAMGSATAGDVGAIVGHKTAS